MATVSATSNGQRRRPYDRFIPFRPNLNVEESHAKLFSTTPSQKESVPGQYRQSGAKSYWKLLADAFHERDSRILPMTPTQTKLGSHFPWSSPCLSPDEGYDSPLKKSKRKVATSPDCIMDMPGLLDDFYTNVLDWGSKNLIAVALNAITYIWNAETRDCLQLKLDLQTTESDNYYVTALTFDVSGAFLAVADNLGDIFDDRPDSYVIENLEREEWFWGCRNRAEIEVILRDGRNGVFLLFQEDNTGSLCLASRNYRGSIKFAKVYACDGFYGFTEPLQFESMDDLMDGFQYSPEMTNNGESEAFIMFPPRQQPLGVNVENLLIRVLELDKLIESKTTDIENIHQEQAEISKRADDTAVSMKACKKIITILNEQVSLQQQSVEQLRVDIAINGFRENNKRIDDKKFQLEGRMKNLDNDVERYRQQWDITVNNMREHEDKLDALTMEREGIKRSLDDFKIDPAFICGLLDTEIEPDLPHFERANWFIDCDLHKAEYLLSGKPDGTFLVRRSATTGGYTITFAFDGNVVNLRVHQKENYYGLDETTCIFQSLEELIVRYSSIPLSVHDSNLGYTTLKFPVLTIGHH